MRDLSKHDSVHDGAEGASQGAACDLNTHHCNIRVMHIVDWHLGGVNLQYAQLTDYEDVISANSPVCLT